ncbi:MAG: PAS domain S-box protein [Anaerolineales bacterium]
MKKTLMYSVLRFLIACVASGSLWILFSKQIIADLLVNLLGYSNAGISEVILFGVAQGFLLYFLLYRFKRSSTKDNNFSLDIFELATVGIFQSSSDGKYIKVNPMMAAIYGYSSPDDMLEAINDISIQVHLSAESRSLFTEALNKYGVIEKFETKNRKKDGSIIWTSTNARAVKGKDGTLLYYEGFITDITRQKNAEHALRDAEKQYRTLIEQMPAAAYIDTEDSFANFFSSQQIFSISGYTAEEWKNDSSLWMKIIHPEDKKEVQEEHERTLKSGEKFDMEYRLITKDGKLVWVHDVASLVMDDKNTPLHWQGILIDVTKQKLAEEQIQISEAQYRMVVEYASDGILVIGITGKIYEANQQMCGLLGFTRTELLELNLEDLLAANDGQIWNSNEIVRGRAVVYEKSLKRKDGTLVLVEISLKSLPNKMIIGIVRNISNRRLMEESLARSEKKFRALIENSMDAVALYSLEGKIIFLSPATSRILGYSPRELIGKKYLDFVCEKDRQKAQEAFEKIIAYPNELVVFSVQCISKDNNLKWLEFNGTNRLNDPDIEAVIANFRDITDRKNFENALFEAEERYRLLVENLPAVIFLDKFNDNQSSQYMSPRIKDLLGYTVDEWKNETNLWEESLHPDDKDRVIAEDQRTSEAREPFRIEYRMRHRDGHYIWVKEDASIITGEDGSPLFWQGVLLNITEQKQAEEALKHRDAILRTVGFSAEQFLKTSDWEKSISSVIAQLGEATGVSRVYIFKKEENEKQGTFVSQIYEWCSIETEPQIDNNNLQNVEIKYDGYPRWADNFEKDMPVFGNVKDFPAEEKKYLEDQGILSIICIPIRVGADWWGFIGFDECKTEREWSEIEIEALRAAANTLGTSIERKNNEESLLNSEMSYRGLFNTVQDAIYIQDRYGKFIDVNEGAVQLYGYPKEDFIGKTPEFLSAPGRNNLKSISQAVQLAFEGIPQQFEFWGQRSNGDIFPKDVRLFKGTYFGKEVIIAVSQDITARKKAEEALQNQFRELSILHLVALAETTARDSDKLIQQITDIISDSLYPDNCGVLFLNEAQDILTPHFSYRGTDIEKMGSSLSIDQGISGKAISTRHSIRVGDVSLEPKYFEIAPSTRSELCAPIISGTTLFGVLNVESRKLNTFTERDERLLNTIAGGVANALERIKLFEAEKKRRMDAEILREATFELTSNFELDKLFESIFTSLARLIRYDSASIEIINQGYIEIVAGKFIPQELIGQKYITDLSKWGGLENFRQAKIIADIQNDEGFVKFGPTNYIRGWMGIPLLIKDKIIGFLNLDSRTQGFFNNDHAAIAQTFANQAAIAIENTRLFELEQRRRTEAENLQLATSSLANTLDVNSLLENILDWLRILTPYDSASIMLKQGDVLELAGMRDLPEIYKVGDLFNISNKWNDVAANHKALIVEDAAIDSRFEKWKDSEYIHGWMSVPMFMQDELIGFINLDSRTPGAFTEESASLIQTFANQAATAIEKARLFNLEKKRLKSAETLLRAATELTNLLDLPTLQNAILEWLYKIAPYDSASILSIEEDQIRVSATKGSLIPENILNRSFPADNVLCKIINETGQTLIIEDCKKDDRFEDWGVSQYVRGWMGVPLISRGQVIGYLTIDSRTPGAFSQDDAIAAQTFAHQAATALENTSLYSETKKRLEELEMVNRVSFALRTAKDTKEMIPILLGEIKSSIDTDTSAIWIYNQEKNILSPHTLSGWTENMPKPNFRPGEGIVGKVFSSGLPHLSNDISEDPISDLENKNFLSTKWSGLAVPIRTSLDTIGVIMVAREHPLKVESHHVRMISTLADIAGNAIYRSSLFQQSEEQIRRLTTLREVDTAITSSLDLRITLNILTEHLTSKMGVSAARILVYNPNSQMLDSYTSIGFNNSSSSRQSIGIGDGLASQTLLSRKELWINNIEDEKNILMPEYLLHEGFQGYFAMPLFSKGATRGLIETYFRYNFTPTTDWKDFLKTLAGQATIAIDNAQLFENLQRSNQELSLAYDTTLEGWGKALELRDKETKGHTNRVANLTLELARQMGIPESEITHIRRGTLLHDIGKMGVPDNILRKPGPLTEEETKEMRRHPQYAYDLLYPIAYLRPTLDIAYCHHEWWNGSGYPRNLKGEEIPLPARIFAIVDVWDALLSDRPYRKAWVEADVIKYITDLSGKQFDPRIVNEFMKLIKKKSPPHKQKEKPFKKKAAAKTKKKR